MFYVTGEEGPSLMGLEDMAMFRALPTATIFYPSDGVTTEKAVELAAITKVPKVLAPLQYQWNIYLFVRVPFSCLGGNAWVPPHLTGCLLYPNQPPRQCRHL